MLPAPRLLISGSIALAILAGGLVILRSDSSAINDQRHQLREREATTRRASLPKKSSFLISSVPFTPQAPDGNWKDDRFQDGCEEASSLMAVKWAREETIAPAEAKREMLAMAQYEQERFGNFHNTSAQDTTDRIIKGYFQYPNAEVKLDPSVRDIRQALSEGALVIVPLNGQQLGNPYYTAPGPERHMLVITGYDRNRNQFITNDPGTKRGAGYRYSIDVLMASLVNYPTGHHEPIVEQRSAMIIVRKP